VGIFLLDGDCRRDAFYGINVRLLDALQELSGIRRERLDISALALGVDCIECEEDLPDPEDPGHNREGVVGDLKSMFLRL